MSLKAGRVGVNPADVDPIDGHISPSSLEGYTKEEADAKFETQEAAADLQSKRLAVPIEYLNGSVIGVDYTVEEAVHGLNSRGYTRQEANVLGAKNIFDLTLAYLKTKNTTGTWSGNAYTYQGVVYTVDTNDAGYVTNINVNGTNTQNVRTNLTLIDGNASVNGKYLGRALRLGALNGSETSHYLSVSPWNESQRINVYSGSGVFDFASTSSGFRIDLFVAENAQVTNASVKPMITLASDTENDLDHFQPFSMSNQQLTENKLDISDIKSITADAADFSAFKTAIANL